MTNHRPKFGIFILVLTVMIKRSTGAVAKQNGTNALKFRYYNFVLLRCKLTLMIRTNVILLCNFNVLCDIMLRIEFKALYILTPNAIDKI